MFIGLAKTKPLDGSEIPGCKQGRKLRDKPASGSKRRVTKAV